MHYVTVSIGSNIDREFHVSQALSALEHFFAPLTVSNLYDCVPVGFKGENFLNLVVGFECSQSVSELAKILRQIEDDSGRIRIGEKFASRTLDLDILTFDDLVGIIDGVELPRGEITENAFVLRPLADIIPDDIHPLTTKTYAQLWREYDKDTQQVTKTDHIWHKSSLKRA
ncbi:2-amino-4-hydroxy-6-hydroxymethyldihydropteridine diphosphokinase [Vibrio neptunius]|uniref:2-amino-4-hydroxy-6-hydroxymethyldihydropteridine diphosphokinase n=1 Tax=Vibrio neptunius TaxID=170651 RepID=A0ABS3A5C6_9VIBR|nr:2-amino-4-hydroxy-6-hydroxymethyldihydropteridine diphosphokinase [Vibrio neptunius]MBN3494327.1 2-amino-4-hydroxy-6-hydroxymethyldihydropteridine diphosphokinase [Vibrio neptunius]MBN3516731.1 2-amino-4-hydroxy-6-hydroxymethyldihydropteridine diphosphokinase [Vibrio neptunius]MBN3550999.1 2-amino-4-hydroxy-6-hydroxymethyldihydropteridine diphosphokinase [Vibrio neptunius]MBN3579084.1 2-amino-4-hydroxy-6-hydroxymethyldihydropteridine diphosphokinase [Vibrio neptunius]MCH9872748.1 2-amino-4-